jgi:hypothetical protein
MKLACIIKIETIVSEATIFSVTYDRHNDDPNSFIIQAKGKALFKA